MTIYDLLKGEAPNNEVNTFVYDEFDDKWCPFDGFSVQFGGCFTLGLMCYDDKERYHRWVQLPTLLEK